MPNELTRIEILAFPGVQLLDVAGPLQVFSTANEILNAQGMQAHYEITVVGKHADTLTSSGLAIATHQLPSSDDPIDTLVVAGGRGVNAAIDDDALLSWIRQRSQEARRTASVCSGAFLLAEAGLLEGRRAVTHWGRCAEFAARYPSVRLEQDPIFVCDGTVWTSAGITAGIDLTLNLVEADLGRSIATAVARHLVVYLRRPGGQAQFSTALSLQGGESGFDRLHAWILENLRGDLSLSRLAEQAHMSTRSFSRHYHQATGITPARAIEKLRVEAARQMLGQSMPVSRVSRQCGFGSEETMRRAFLRNLGVTPREYRERFGAT
ncbi:AraC family transcriptional regulator [Paramesorhizobium deserti]|uniref:AraC family transcriptional regulator n=1 Tax=Paramesorhizobium deserti TaxID=1494590 RepID=A0A135HNM5_9HYPH|nr:GlxA family transcriptional regulator [Paramesorhizobium deserti]KXF74799.1 AraC family transcriptional regulator [Paramesorhizobium deserti]